MLLSVTRTIAIARPLYRIKKKCVLLSSLLYCFLTVLEFLVGMFPDINYTYLYSVDNPNCYQMATVGLPFNFQYFIEAANILLISVFTVISFVVAIFKLSSASMTKRAPSRIEKPGETMRHAFLHASVTVVIFTAVVLICSIPMFVNVLLGGITGMLYTFPGPFFSEFYMAYYSWMVAKVVCVVLNASLNPVIYFFRMKDFNSWARSGILKRMK